MEPLVKLEEIDGIGVITLNRPEKLNALDIEMKKELGDKVHAAVHSEAIRVILITGAGRAFCAGGDVISFKKFIEEPHFCREDLSRLHESIFTLFHCEKPVVIAVNGAAVGGGCNLALMGDVVYASDDAYFIEPFGSLGLIPDLAGLYILPRLMGLRRATKFIFDERRVNAEEAMNLGLVSDVVPREELFDRAFEYAKRLAEKDSKVLGVTKTLINRGLDMDLHSYLAMESLSQYLAMTRDNVRHAVEKFTSK